MDDRAYFNKLATAWDETSKQDPDKLKTIIALIGLKKGDKVADIGTGTGVLLPSLLEEIGENGHIDAFDVSENMLEIAKAKFKSPNINFIHTDATQVKSEAIYDIIICFNVFPHFKSETKALVAFTGILKQGGSLVITHSHSKEEVNAIHKKAGDAVENDVLMSGEKLAEMIKNVGLNVLNVIDNDKMFFVKAEKL